MFLRIFKKFADLVASDDASLWIDRMSKTTMKSGQMPSYRDDIKNTHVFRNRKNTVRGVGSEEIRKIGQIGALRVFISCSSATREGRNQSTAGLRRADPAIMVPASVHICSHPTLVNLLWRNLGLDGGCPSNTHQVGLPSGRNSRSKGVVGHNSSTSMDSKLNVHSGHTGKRRKHFEALRL